MLTNCCQLASCSVPCKQVPLTPPFGYNLFLMKAMAPPNISIIDIYLSVITFVFVMVLALAVVMVFPEIALWLAEYVYNK